MSTEKPVSPEAEVIQSVDSAPSRQTVPVAGTSTAKPQKAVRMVAGGAVLLVLLAGGFAFATRNRDHGPKNEEPQGGGVTQIQNSQSDQSGQTVADAKPDQFSTDPVTVGEYLSNSNCVGEGSKLLNHPVMMPADLSIIMPYGLTAGGHVTPVDHQYYLGKDQKAAKDTYNVYAPADGTIVDVQVRPRGEGKADYRGVISYSCTFFSYFDLATSLSPEIASQMPAGWETKNGPQAVKIPVKEGQIVGKIGGQTLDYAVWDTTKNLAGLLVPKAYANYEPWKIHTVKPLDYYTDSLKAQVLPFYARSVEPRDGTLAYDVDGKAVGSWFAKGTNGYIGAFNESSFNSMTYADGHLSIAPDLYDPTGWVFSTGQVEHGTQYGIKAPVPLPSTVDVAAGAVKYSLVQLGHRDDKGAIWLGQSVPKSISLDTATSAKGTALVQMVGDREMKVELFLGKTAAQVSGFTGAAVTYTRGDDATAMMR